MMDSIKFRSIIGFPALVLEKQNFLTRISLKNNQGTGSKPEGPKGRHLIKRRKTRYDPLNAPCRFIASIAYSEQEGTNRHEDGNNGERKI